MSLPHEALPRRAETERGVPSIAWYTDRDLLRLAVEFDLGEIDAFGSRVSIRKCEGHRLPKPVMWKIVNDCSFVLTKNGDWEKEPQPSSRDDEFYERARYETLAEAYAQVVAEWGLQTPVRRPHRSRQWRPST